MQFLKRHFFPLFFLIFLLALLPFSVKLVQLAQKYLTRALGQPANIVVDTSAVLGPMPQPWRTLAQGGEEDENMLTPVISETRTLEPKYIRIDHLFNRYGVVEGGKNGQMVYNFSRLDKIVNDVLKTGALPFLSLSYMPPSLSRDGNITSPPENWNDWEEIVRVTIEHFSGKSGKNLKDIYYEVWNEPDLFGQWKLGKDPDYLLLYRHTAIGAGKAKGVNQFFLGGPATTGLYPNWLKSLFSLGVKLDFISWHRYALNPTDFAQDTQVLEDFLEKNPNYFYIKRLMTEWGSNPENSPLHDLPFDAIHTIASIRQLLNKVDLAFSFEIKDGLSPEGKKYWGRWGLLTHEKVGLEKKPRYFALLWLNRMQGERISVSGEGTWVTGFSTKKDGAIKLLLTNFDLEGKHAEVVPLTFINLPGTSYLYKESFFSGQTLTTQETLTTDTLQKNISLPPHSAVLVELEPK